MDKLPLVVVMEPRAALHSAWNVRLHFEREADSFPSAIVCGFNARAAECVKGVDFTHWGETRKTNG